MIFISGSACTAAMFNNSSSQDVSSAGYLKLLVEFSIFRLSLEILIAVFGVIGNLVVIAKIIRGTNALSVMSPYLLSLAFADLGILLFNNPPVIWHIEFQHDEWFFGELVCLYFVPFTETFFGACIWSITAIAAERYVKVAWKFTVPTSNGGRRSSKRILFILIAIWLVSFLITALPLYSYQKYDPYQCYNAYPPSLHRKLATINAILMYVLPLGIIAFSYQRIGKLVKERAIKLRQQTPNPSLETSRSTMKKNEEAILNQTRKTQRILKPLVVFFAVTMLPYQMFMLTMVYWDTFHRQSYYYILMAVVSISVATNSAADPLVYCVSNRDFLREIKTSLVSRCFSIGRLITCRERVISRRSKVIRYEVCIQTQAETVL